MNPEKRAFDPHDPQYRKYEDLPSEAQPYFVSSADRQGFVLKSARENDGSMDARALHSNSGRTFFERIFGKNFTGMDMVMIEAQLTNAVTDIVIKHDRAICTFDVDDHCIVLEGVVHAQRSLSSDRRAKTVYIFVVDAGTIDGEMITKDQYEEYAKYMGPSIINKMHMMAMKQKIVDADNDHTKNV